MFMIAAPSLNNRLGQSRELVQRTTAPRFRRMKALERRETLRLSLQRQCVLGQYAFHQLYCKLKRYIILMPLLRRSILLTQLVCDLSRAEQSSRFSPGGESTAIGMEHAVGLWQATTLSY